MYTVILRDPADRERLCAFFRDVHVCVLGAEGAIQPAKLGDRLGRKRRDERYVAGLGEEDQVFDLDPYAVAKQRRLAEVGFERGDVGAVAPVER